MFWKQAKTSLVWKQAKTTHHFCLKTLKLDNIALIRYGIIWSHDVPNVKQHIALY